MAATTRSASATTETDSVYLLHSLCLVSHRGDIEHSKVFLCFSLNLLLCLFSSSSSSSKCSSSTDCTSSRRACICLFLTAAAAAAAAARVAARAEAGAP